MVQREAGPGEGAAPAAPPEARESAQPQAAGTVECRVCGCRMDGRELPAHHSRTGHRQYRLLG